MASASAAVSASGIQDVDGLLSGLKWAFTGGPVVLYNFPTSASYYASPYPNDFPDGFVGVSAAFKATFRKALAEFASVIDVTFSEVGSGAASDISVARSSVLATLGYNGYGRYPGLGDGGDVWFDDDTNNIPDTTSPGRGTWRLVMHEIGHAMGLKHSFETGGAFGQAVAADHDFNDYTIMSYRRYENGPTSNTADRNSSPQSLMMLDIQALQYLYGANFETNAGDTTYTFDAATGQMFVNGVGSDMPSANRIYRTIWDGNGVDTYDFSNYTTSMAIDLRPGKFSTLSAAQLAIVDAATGQTALGNLFNALQYQKDARSLIENATGGSGKDRINGNDAANTLLGGAASDRLSAYKGADVVKGGAGNDRITGGLGGDVLTGNAGRDTFVYLSIRDSGRTNASRDTITDFKIGADRINLKALDAIPGGADQAFSFIGEDSFTAAGQVRAVASGRNTKIEINTDTDATAEASILLKNVAPGDLSSLDFIL